MKDLTTTVGEFELPECAPPGAAAVEFSNAERTDRIIIANIDPHYDQLEGAQVDYDLFGEDCQPVADEVADYWEDNIHREVEYIIENWR